MARSVSRPTQSQPTPGPSAWAIISTVLCYVLLIILTLLFLAPFYLIIRNGLASESEITSSNWTFFPSTLHFENIQELFKDTEVPFLDGMINSTIIAVLQTIGQILVSALAGYGLARIPYRRANQVFFAILVTLMIPSACIFVPPYVIVPYRARSTTLQRPLRPALSPAFPTPFSRQ